ncbi:hypothetical protein [Corallococcus llansteffanensis]|uniref:Uncharacterized protein n=1 Tax=Corallococcus llansteffanensis TaxID=2316731 RepID=A0A3A8PLH2_9BACT|nr:hypothetical protein [Corallococcus llansteffanensis]RKH57233.1 hypothetical protein D7V93_18785 [Corallococcus llansteffanensis]
MKRFTKSFGMSVALVLLAAPVVYAGSKTTFNLIINTTSRYAEGSMGSTRNTADAVQRIYCRSDADATGAETMRCFATNLAGVTVTCNSSSPVLIRSLQAAGDESYVSFSWDASGICQSFDVLKGSHLAPKDP